MLTTVEHCSVCKTMREMLVNPMQLKLYSDRPEGQSMKDYSKTRKQTGTVTAWIVCSVCNTAVRSEETYAG